jgi:hypothetical protein
MGTGPTVEQYRFDAWDLPTKYGWMHSGPGVQAATLMQDLVNRMAERMIISGELVGRLLRGAEWAGEAASAAGRAMQRGAGQINQTAAEAATAQRCVTELGESFQTAQHRVPSPNEIPTGLGDRFLYGAAEGVKALSPFDVQSPLHDAMEQRRELDQQANLALTNHMITSRDRVEAIPAIAGPAPMVVTGQLAGAPGSVVEQPAGVVPTAAGFGGTPAATAPVATMAAGWSGVPATPSASPGPGDGNAPFPPGASPVSTGLAGATDGVTYHPRPGTFQPTGTGAGPHDTVFGPSTGAGGSAARGGVKHRVRPGAGRDGMPSRGAPGRDGPLVGGPTTPGLRGAGVSGARISGGSRVDAGSFMQPPVGGRGNDDHHIEDIEHKDRYAQHVDHIVGELPLVAPAVIGETPGEEHRSRDRR